MPRSSRRALRYLPQEIIAPGAAGWLPRRAQPGGPADRAAGPDRDPRLAAGGADASRRAALASAIERMAPALRALRHGDGGLVLFNGAKEESPVLIDLVLTQAGRGGRARLGLTEGGFHRLQAGRSVLVIDCGAAAAAGHRPAGPCRHALDGALGRAGAADRQLRRHAGRGRAMARRRRAPPPRTPRW